MRRTGWKESLLSVLLCFLLVFTAIPIDSFAESANHAPTLTAEYQDAEKQITVQIPKSYVLDLHDVFTDRDGNELTYYMRFGEGAYRQIEHKCFYKPDEEGVTTVTFKANDGLNDSEEYTVELVSVYPEEGYVMQFLSSENGTETASGLASLVIHTGITPGNSNVLVHNEGDSYTTGLKFDADTLTYQLEGIVYDNSTPQLGFRAEAANSADTVILSCEGESQVISWESGSSKYVNFFTAGKKEFSILVGSSDAAEASKEYKFTIDVIPTLTSLAGDTGYWNQEFAAKTTDYTITLPEGTKKLTFEAAAKTEGCEITYNGTTSNVVDISETDKVEIIVSKDGVSNTYTVNLNKQKAVDLTLKVTPSDALIAVYDHKGTRLKANEDGSYTAMFGTYEHTYMVSRSGYISVSGEVPAEGGTLTVSLEKVTGEQPEEVDAYWANFRNSDANMAITDVQTPRSEDASKVTPKWIADIKSEAGDDPSVPIIVDNALVLMAKKTLYKLDLETGEVIKKADMAAVQNHGYTPLTYAAGMIFCPLANGTVQAFNASTLESLWIYKDPLGGQSLSPITYSDGYIYTGFWTGESKDANYVCISITDDDVKKTDEAKNASWTHTQKGGFYWAGSVVIGDAVIVGTDDGQAEGTHGTSILYSFDKVTGDVISALQLQGDAGDQRSSIAYDKENSKIYCTTKGGYLYRADVNKSSGELSGLESIHFDGASTSTPVIYGNRIYYGTGKGFAKGFLRVADTDSFQELFSIPMKAYPQCSALLSTAYEESGYLYLYSTYNGKPGGISAIKVKTDCRTASDAVLTELYLAEGYEEYCITSVICDADGTLYYKNDSGNVFAIGLPTYENVIKLINEIGTVTLDSAGKITAAREAYDALDSGDKAKVTNYQTLTKAEKQLEELQESAEKAEEASALIRAIGIVKLTSNEKIEKARKAYDVLSKYEKSLVKNLSTLEYAEDKYEDLVKDAVEEVEDLIDAIGKVTSQSKAAVKSAREAYDELPEHIQKLISNYDELTDAEDALEKIKPEGTTKELDDSTETSKTDSGKTSTTGKSSSSTAGSGSSVKLSKSQLLQFQDKLDAVTNGIEYEEALGLIKSYYSLNEEQQLALANKEGLEILKSVIADENHADASTGIRIEDVEWNIQLAVEDVEDINVMDIIAEKLPEKELLGFWDIHLEDILTGRIYYPQEAVVMRIPVSLVKDYTKYDKFSILHCTGDGMLEVLNCKEEDGYLVFQAMEFSCYAVIGGDGLQTEETDLSNTGFTKPVQKENGNRSWMLWSVLGALGILLFGVLLYLKTNGGEEDEEETEEM